MSSDTSLPFASVVVLLPIFRPLLLTTDSVTNCPSGPRRVVCEDENVVTPFEEEEEEKEEDE